MTVFWSLVAFILTGLLLWLIFFADDDAVLRTLRIPTDGDVDGDGDVDAADLAAAQAAVQAGAGDSLHAPARVAAMNAEDEALAAATHAAAATAEAAAASLEAATAGTEEAVAAAEEAVEAADSAVEAAAEAVEKASGALEATTDQASGAAVDAEESLEAAAAAAVEQLRQEEAALEAEARESVTATRSAAVVDLGAAGLTATDNHPDDLTKVYGIGEVYQRRLYEAGVCTWSQIAQMSAADLEKITEAIDAANVEDWASEARKLAEANGRVGAHYDGPLPDRLTFLPGIGEGAQELLRQHGIVTFRQFVDADREALQATLKAGGSRADLGEAIAAAKKLLEKSA